MVLRAIAAVALVSASFAPTAQVAAAPASPSASASGGVCAKLTADYEQINKALALTYAEGVGDDSAPRETNRQVETANNLSRASMTLTLMQAHHCSMPDYEPSVARYMSPALTCATDMLKSGADAASCKMESWQPSK